LSLSLSSSSPARFTLLVDSTYSSICFALFK
jgi:hypothetical protein